jgi:transcription elongation factor GreB
MTRKGYQKIQAEIDRLWTQERPMVVEEVYEAAQLGDRSENAAYIYGKRRLRLIDKRLGNLRRKVKDVTQINVLSLPARPDAQFGAWVLVEDEEGETRGFRLVDQAESDPKEDRISVQSPIGNAVLGRRAGDSVEVRLPRGITEFEILRVHYGPDPQS